MNDEEYQNLKNRIKVKKFNFDDLSWGIGFLKNIKDKNNQESLIMFLNTIIENTFQETFDQVVDLIDKEYIKISEIPTTKEVFREIDKRIKNEEDILKSNKEEVVELMKKRDKEKDYDKLKEINSSIWWKEHYIDDANEKIKFLKEMKELITFDIKRAKKVSKV
jgi:hypothetical protein